MLIPEAFLLLTAILAASQPLFVSASPAAHHAASSPHPRRRVQQHYGNGSPVERVLRSDGGPGLVLGRAIVVRDFRRTHRQHDGKQGNQQPPHKHQQQPRRDWCRTAPLMQRVWERGCQSALLRNRYCYGQCKSFYVPNGYNVAVAGASGSGNGTALDVIGIGRGGAAAFVSCAACKPVKYRPARVTFVCPGQKPPLRKRTLRRVHRCRCLAADSQS